MITTDVNQLLKKTDEYQPAQIVLIGAKDTLLSTTCEIRSRGNARKSICKIPPTKLRFDKTYLTRINLSTFPTIKIVGACTTNERDADYLLTERKIYEANHLLTEMSFRTHAMHIEYIDVLKPDESILIPGFVLEHEDELAIRLRSEVYEIFFQKEMLNRSIYVDFSVFQYMIGNTDWKIFNHHNLKILTRKADRLAFPIAYDFDYSGLVKAYYAVPNDELEIDNVTQRLYLGPCLNSDEIESIREKFLKLENQIMEIFGSGFRLNHRAKYCQKYLSQFFDLLKNENASKRTFKKCIDY